MRRDTFFWGSILIILGILFLLENAGFLGNIDIWGLFWPLVLIFLGFWILFNYFVRTKSETEMVKIAIDDEEKANIRFDHGIGRLIVKSDRNQVELISGTFGGGIEYSKESSGGQANIRLKMPQRWFPFWLPGTVPSTTWDVALKSDFPLSLSFNTGGGEANLDLSELLVQKVVLKTGASSTKIILPDSAGYTTLIVEAGVASVVIQVPSQVAARIRAEGGLASLNIDRERFPKQGGAFVSKEFETAENKVDIDISGGISSVSVI